MFESGGAGGRDGAHTRPVAPAAAVLMLTDQEPCDSRCQRPSRERAHASTGTSRKRVNPPWRQRRSSESLHLIGRQAWGTLLRSRSMSVRGDPDRDGDSNEQWRAVPVRARRRRGLCARAQRVGRTALVAPSSARSRRAHRSPCVDLVAPGVFRALGRDRDRGGAGTDTVCSVADRHLSRSGDRARRAPPPRAWSRPDLPDALALVPGERGAASRSRRAVSPWGSRAVSP